jgi:subfamily B ATP-binding cassette protein HlyB/CyaB
MDRKRLEKDAFFWTLQAICALHRKPFSLDLACQQFAAPYCGDSLCRAADFFGFDASLHKIKQKKLCKESFPLVVWLSQSENSAIKDPAQENQKAANVDQLPENEQQCPSLGLVLQADNEQILLIEPGDTSPVTITIAEFSERYLGFATRFMLKSEPSEDPDNAGAARQSRRFGFKWFMPELLRHKKIWQEILLASLFIQIIALTTPLFTQTIIDKVVVHHTQSTLIVIAIALVMFTLFSAGLSWLRQYLVLHTGNRVDAVLGRTIFEHLFKLPPQYFHYRPTGVIAARMHGIETIREFIASAAITLLLDMPFLLIFVAIMFYYSVSLTLIVLGMLLLIAIMSVVVAPMFQQRLQQQFQLGARNQAFMTEYIVGLETVKSLQLEPSINAKYNGYLASYLSAGFATKQLANTYNTSAGLIEQTMGLLILTIGAYSVMTGTDFTIGMLVAFQMFSSRLSGPLLRLVGLWQQFQQARLSVERLGDLMNAAAEPYSVIPARTSQRSGAIKIEAIAFKYADHLPLVYENLSLDIHPGQVIGLVGASGCGKSTLAKLLQGFYQPSAGRITIDGTDIRYMSVNELRNYFGIVPQETVLFSGTVYDNLQLASPHATFEQITAACKMANIHAVIEALPLGYQTEIGERGAGLSGGQRQRIAIARALLKHPKILIFDEATSALDGTTTEHITRTINALRGKVTMLVIAHGLPKGLHFDALYQLGSQGIDDLGSPQALATSA